MKPLKDASLTVTFKSWNEFYNLESSGAKPTTLRKIDPKDERFSNLLYGKVKYIIIENTSTLQSFKRKITDYTEFEGFGLISWNSNEEGVQLLKTKIDDLKKFPCEKCDRQPTFLLYAICVKEMLDECFDIQDEEEKE